MTNVSGSHADLLPSLQQLVKNGEIGDRDCVLQEVMKSASLRDEPDATLEKDAILLLHKAGRLEAKHRLPEQLPPADIVFKELLESKALSIRRPHSADNHISSHFDLYPLYGGGPSDFDKIRLKDGSGMLSPDCFFDDRLIFLPRAAAVLLILFNRNHNYIARRLLLHRETPADIVGSADGALSQSLKLQDDDIFEKARRINCGHFRNIMLEDMLKPLLGLPIVGPSHKLNLLSEVKGAQVPLGNGFDGPVESALLYDWSPIMSLADIQHFEEAMREIANDDAEKVSLFDFDQAVEDFTTTMNASKRNRDCAGLQRGEGSRFRDSDLAQILYDATECPARGAGQGIPSCQRVMQIKVIERARSSKAGSLNDYRRFLGLKALQSFKEWSSNPSIAASAEKLYKSIDNLEVYVGLQAEDTIKNTADSGFRFGYTKTYGLLVDIVSRVRSDPTFTTQFFAEILTLWGYGDCSLRPNNGSFGASMPKLLQRTLPHDYQYNSIYGLFPLATPEYTIPLLPEPKPRAMYSIERPQPHKVHHLATKEAISHVFNQPKLFPTIYNDSLIAVTGGYGYFLGFDDEERHDQDQMMSLHALIPDKGALRRYADSFANMANECIKETAVTRPGEIDVAHDVINAVCTRWVCETLLDYPLKQAVNGAGTASEDIPGPLMRYIWRPFWGRFSKIGFVVQLLRRVGSVTAEGKEQERNSELQLAELHDKFASLYAFVFHNIDSEDAWKLRETALRTSAALSTHICRKLPHPRVISVQSYTSFLNDSFGEIRSLLTQIVREFTTGTMLPEQTAQTFLDRVVSANQSISQHLYQENANGATLAQTGNARVVANVLGLAIVAAVKYAKVCTQAVNFYFQDEYLKEREEIVRLSLLNDPKSTKLLMGYIREAYRLDNPLGIWRQASSDAVIPQSHGLPGIRVSAGDRIYADFSKAFNNPSVPDHARVDPNRETQGIQGLGLHKCPGISFADHTMPEIFKAIFRLENLRRAPGRAGSLVRFSAHPGPRDTAPKLFLNTDPKAPGTRPEDVSVQLASYPRSLVLQYDAKNVIAAESIAQKRKKWKIDPGKTTQNMRAIMDRTLSVIVIFLMFWTISYMINSIMSFFSPTPHTKPPPPSSPSPTSAPPAACLPPTTPIQSWEITSMKAGDDGRLIPLQYTLDLPTAHSLSMVDVDAKDMKMAIWLDKTLLGITADIELNKSENCGDNFGDCLNRGFSGGYVVIPKGNHTVRIEWAGVEKPGPDGKVDWGEEAGRRLAWSRDACAV
ncbi:hypothetical protein GALMADRAFT_282379 [Galerina marginata CBS 339.88]|uniref:Heme peroxidase n=1 Tax=Galerina marginata (strain CBS 339.88) TaxID=685588 RepID=A0A067SGE6_GALM3|nr:hypothetical protein GALMADRAFT_282379 [Galerina marginata CBS 339.88]